jgi:hypothetical protein
MAKTIENAEKGALADGRAVDNFFGRNILMEPEQGSMSASLSRRV